MPYDLSHFFCEPSRTSAVSISLPSSSSIIEMKEKPKLQGLGYKSSSSIIFQVCSIIINSLSTTLKFSVCWLLNTKHSPYHTKAWAYTLCFPYFNSCCFSDEKKELKHLQVNYNCYSRCFHRLKGIQVESECHQYSHLYNNSVTKKCIYDIMQLLWYITLSQIIEFHRDKRISVFLN